MENTNDGNVLDSAKKNLFKDGIRLDIVPDNITYGYAEYRSFSVRKVYINNVINNEYHLRANDVPVQTLLASLKQYFGGYECVFGLVDPSMQLNIDYPIFLVINDEMVKESVDDIFKNISNNI